MIAVMFPGQGAQKKGMGGTLFAEFPDLVEIADRVLGYSIEELCLRDPRGQLSQTEFTQPALYVVNALAYRKRTSTGAAAPDALVGHSLGELNALAAAGVFDFETGLRLVKRRGELMSGAPAGGMAAIMGVGPEEVEATLSQAGLREVDVANLNAPGQVVISGLEADLKEAAAAFQQIGKGFLPLNTGGPFHSRLMRPAAEAFASFLKPFSFAAPRTLVMSNYTGEPHSQQEVSANLAHQIASPVRWVQCIEYLLARGEVAFEEVGGTQVLTNLVARIKGRRGDRPAAAASPPPPLPAQEKVRTWNERFRPGTKVRSKLFAHASLETQSEAVLLFGHRAAVYLKGYNGYFDLDEVAPLS